MTTPAARPDLSTLDDDQLISQRAALRARLQRLPWHDLERMTLEHQYEELTGEFDRRARAAWGEASAALRRQASGPADPAGQP